MLREDEDGYEEDTPYEQMQKEPHHVPQEMHSDDECQEEYCVHVLGYVCIIISACVLLPHTFCGFTISSVTLCIRHS